MKPGIYPDLDIEDYHSGPGLSSTELKPLSDGGTIAEFLHERENITISPDARERGHILHDAILTPDAPDHAYRFYDAHKTRCKTYQKWAKKNECIGLFPDDLEMVAGIRRQLADHEIIQGGLLSDGKAECSFFAEISGELCKVRPDWLAEIDEGNVILDLKSLRKGYSHRKKWSREMDNRKYDLSAAMYCDVVEAATGKPVVAYLFLVVEKEPPYLTAIYHLQEESLAVGRGRFHDALDKYKRWQAGEIKHLGHPQTIQPIDLPKWRLNQ